MIRQPYQPLPYTITPARGQALLNFQGRRMPDHLPLFETVKVEEVRPAPNDQLPGLGNVTAVTGPNLLLHGDGLSACAYLKANNIKVDLFYIDPPFASGANYAKVITLRSGEKTALAVEENTIGEEIMYGDIWQKEDYLNWLYERLLAMRDVMSENGLIFVHLDWNIGHYVKILLDEIFGEQSFLNNIVWCYKTRQFSKRYWNRKHHDIFVYANGDDYVFNWNEEGVLTAYSPETIAKFKLEDEIGKYRLCGRGIEGSPIKGAKDVDPNWEKTNPDLVVRDYLDAGYAPSDYWEIEIVNQAATERTDYSTQKPEELLQRIIRACSHEGMIVADLFCGSGTAAKVAHDLKRRFVACDIGLNAIQSTRDRLAAAGASFDILKIQDGIRLFRNPAQTMAKIFSLVEGFKKREELKLGEFWDGGLPGPSGRYIPLKFVGLHERLTPELLDGYLEEIYQLESDDRADGVRILYAHCDLNVDQEYVNKRLRESGKTQLKVELVSINQLLDKKAASLFTPDSVVVDVRSNGKDRWEVIVKQYFSPYLKAKIDEFNAKRGKRNGGLLPETNGEENGNGNGDENGGKADKPSVPFKAVKISETGLELIEAVQFDTTLREDGVWISDPFLEDKAGPKEKVKGRYILPTDHFRIKFRNIAGDEIIWDQHTAPFSSRSSGRSKNKRSKKA